MINMNSIRTGMIVVVAILLLGTGARIAVGQTDSYTRLLSTTMSTTNSLFSAQTAVIEQRQSMAKAAGMLPAGTSPYTAPSRPQPMPQLYPITATDFKPVSAPVMPDQLANAATG